LCWLGFLDRNHNILLVWDINLTGILNGPFREILQSLIRISPMRSLIVLICLWKWFWLSIIMGIRILKRLLVVLLMFHYLLLLQLLIACMTRLWVNLRWRCFFILFYLIFLRFFFRLVSLLDIWYLISIESSFKRNIYHETIILLFLFIQVSPHFGEKLVRLFIVFWGNNHIF